MKLHLVRHGETAWNLEKRIQGTIDVDLNQTGMDQASAFAATLARDPVRFDGIKTSHLKRAQATARIIEATTGLPVAVVPDLHEMDLGSWQGLTWKEVEAQYPHEYRHWLVNRRTVRTPRGESYDDVVVRVLKSLKTLCDQGSGDLLVVTHGAVLLSLQCLLNGVAFTEMDRFHVSNLERIVVEAQTIHQLAEDSWTTKAN